MAGGALLAGGEHTEETTEDAQETEQQDYCGEHLTDETLKTTYHSCDRKQGEVDHRLFLSTV